MTYAADLARHYAEINHRIMTAPKKLRAKPATVVIKARRRPWQWPKTCELPTKHPRFANDDERILWIIDHMPAWSLSQRRVLLELTATAFDIDPDDIMSDSRLHIHVVPRHVAMVLALIYLGHSELRVGRDFNRDHTCVRNAMVNAEQAVRNAMTRSGRMPAAP